MKAVLAKLTSAERLRYTSHGELPLFCNALTREVTEVHPVVGLVSAATASKLNYTQMTSEIARNTQHQ